MLCPGPEGNGMENEPKGLRLGDSVVRTFRVAKIHRENTDRVNHIDFSSNGELLISSGEDDQIVIYDCEKGIVKRSLNSKKYGVDLIHFTHAKNAAVHSSTKVDDTIRYLSLHDNKYLRYFPGHTKKVTTMCLSPTDDLFLSGSLDKTLRMWDLRSPNCQGLMHLDARPITAFDPEGLIFCVGTNNNCIKLYDLRSFDKGPFMNFRYNSEQVDGDWTHLKFGPDGKTMMVCSPGCIRILEAFQGTPLQTFTLGGGTGYAPGKKIVQLEASYSPDAQYVFCGSEDGAIHVWSVESGTKVCVLHGDHPGPIQCVKFNPKMMMFASACTNMAFWLPDEE